MTDPAYATPKEYSTLAFYNIDVSESSTKTFYDAVVNILSQFQLTPTLCCVKWNNIEKGWRKFPRLHKQLNRDGFANITAMELYSQVRYEHDVTVPYYLNALWTMREHRAIITLCSSLRSHIDWRAIAEHLVTRLKPAYGIGFRRDGQKGPTFFAMGINAGSGSYRGPEHEEACRLTRWSLADKSVLLGEGILRDVFEWNFLTKPQLDRPVGELTLTAWIQKDVTRGILSPVNNDVTLWEVDIKYQPEIFRSLYEANAIFR